MNCDDITAKLAESQQLNASERQHLSECSRCAQILDLFTVTPAALNEDQILRLRTLATEGLKPVRRLPSDGAIAAVLIALFLIVAISVASAIRMFAIRVLSPFQMVIYFGLLLAVGLACSLLVAQEMIPGAKRRLRLGWVLGGSAVLVCGIVAALFPSLDLRGFVRYGCGCLEAGLACAAVAALVLGAVARLGFARSRVALGSAVGFLAGLVGVSALALHCPLLTIPHILVWHLGVLWIATATGAAIGSALSGNKNHSRA